jgi:cytochrome c551/c552
MSTDNAKPDAASEAAVPKDPIITGSILWPTFLSVVALVLCGAWALYDEGFVRRPYKAIQKEWVEKVAPVAYRGLLPGAQKEVARLIATPEYQELKAASDAAQAAVAPTRAELADELSKAVTPRISVLAEPVKVARSEAAALTYRAQHARADGDRAKEQQYLAALKVVKERKVRLHFPGEDEPVEWDMGRMVAEFNRLKSLQGRIQGRMARIGAEADAAKARLDDFVKSRLRTADPEAVNTILAGLDEFIYEIKQIHVKTGTGPGEELVDRCETCHLGIRSPIALTLADVQGRREFVSHPQPELLQVHDPERFGCSPCHGGNGIALTSVEKAHGRYKHWLWPLHYPENREAGCVQCHQTDQYLDHAETLNRGRAVFFERGCWGCHAYKGFNPEAEELKNLAQADSRLAHRIRKLHLEIARQVEIAEDPASSAEQVEAAYAAAPPIRQALHLAETEHADVARRIAELDLEAKKVGPNLAEVTAKLRPEWLPSWLLDPRAFRHDTKMPRFRLDAEQAASIAAFLWQAADPKEVATPGEGDPERGQQLVISRGCLGCHRVETDEYGPIGNDFAADLSRMGEKASYPYLVSWLRDPRYHNKHGIMPNLRLSVEDAQDMASWLVTKRKEDAAYPDEAAALAVLTDKSRFAEGETLVKHLGCAGCHEIRGLEAEGPIGVELTQEGSKPLERLDFGTLTHVFKKKADPRHPGRKSQYDHKGFFENKLRNPAIWDDGRMFESWFDRTRMPAFWPRPAEEPALYASRRAEIEADIDAVTTFLLGSVEAAIPPALLHAPQGLARDLREGWWVVKKYNCQGCHQILPGEVPAIWKLPIYEDGAGFPGVPGANGRPPTLVGQGGRVDPAWFSNFLANPALSSDPGEIHRNGVRQGLLVRMPTYELSERERSRLVRFFIALGRLSETYVRPVTEKLRGSELDLARAVFTAGDCSNCHLLGGEASINPETTYAPSFQPLAARIRPGWIHKWVTEPNRVIPGTAMPALLSRQPDGRWIIDTQKVSEAARNRVGAGRMAMIAAYAGDHADLLVRYFASWDEEEADFHRRLRGTSPR